MRIGFFLRFSIQTRDGDFTHELSSGRRIDLRLPWFCAASFSPDGKLFALGGWGTDVRLFETTTRKEVARLRGILGRVWGVAFSPGWQAFITSGGGDETVTLWDTESHEKLLTLEGTGSALRLVAFSPDGNIIGCAHWRGLLHLWRAPSWKEIDAAEQAQIGSGMAQSK